MEGRSESSVAINTNCSERQLLSAGFEALILKVRELSQEKNVMRASVCCNTCFMGHEFRSSNQGFCPFQK